MPLTVDELRQVQQYVDSWWRRARELAEDKPLSLQAWKDRMPEAPIALLQKAALEHPNGKIRRFALGILDHEANDESADTFRLALRDPAPIVRLNALHGLSCERCRVGELCTDDVVPALVEVLEHDDSAKVRHASLFPLAKLAARDDRVPLAFARAAENDADELVRQAAAAARDGNYRGIKTRKALRRRQAKIRERADV
jgi:hypothetical protein